MSSLLTITRGDAYTQGRALQVTVTDKAGVNPIDLTGSSLRFMVKQQRGDDDSVALISKTSTGVGGGITIDPDQVTNKGKAVIEIEPADTIDGPTGSFWFELQGVDAVGPVTLLNGLFTIAADLIRTAP